MILSSMIDFFYLYSRAISRFFVNINCNTNQSDSENMMSDINSK